MHAIALPLVLPITHCILNKVQPGLFMYSIPLTYMSTTVYMDVNSVYV